VFIFGARKAHIIPEILSIVAIQCHITSPIDTVRCIHRNGQQVHEPTVVSYRSDLSGATGRNFKQ
jgi:hypothetical protein